MDLKRIAGHERYQTWLEDLPEYAAMSDEDLHPLDPKHGLMLLMIEVLMVRSSLSTLDTIEEFLLLRLSVTIGVQTESQNPVHYLPHMADSVHLRYLIINQYNTFCLYSCGRFSFAFSQEKLYQILPVLQSILHLLSKRRINYFFYMTTITFSGFLILT